MDCGDLEKTYNRLPWGVAVSYSVLIQWFLFIESQGTTRGRRVSSLGTSEPVSGSLRFEVHGVVKPTEPHNLHRGGLQPIVKRSG